MINRRLFLRKSGAVMASFPVWYSSNIPQGVELLVQQDPYALFSKHEEMVVLNDKPWNLEA